MDHFLKLFLTFKCLISVCQSFLYSILVFSLGKMQKLSYFCLLIQYKKCLSSFAFVFHDGIGQDTSYKYYSTFYID